MRYRIKTNGEYYPAVGATTILDELSKPALISWGANMTAKYIRKFSNPMIDDTDHTDGFFVSAKVLDDAPAHFAEARDEAMSTGTLVHTMIEEYIKRKIDLSGTPSLEVSDSAQNSFLAFLEFEKTSGIEWLEAERPVYYEDENIIYAGTLDLVARLNGKVFVLDVKTSSDFYPENWLQVAAYRKARIYLGGKEIGVGFSKDDDGNYVETEEKYSPIEIDGIGIIRLDKETGIPEVRAVEPAGEYRFDKKAGKYITKPANGANMIARYTAAFETLARFYYLYKDRTGLYTTKKGGVGNPVADAIREKYSKGAE
jgi:hypothetical protein